MEFLKSVSHPEEIWALVRFKLGFCKSVLPDNDVSTMSDSMKKCYDYLNKTSRSFSAVIQSLDGDLRHAICIFYLVLRALDTVEDDMTIPIEKKVPMLKTFHRHLHEPEWNFTESKEKDRMVLVDFPVISKEFRQLAPLYQQVIEDICKRMGEGMTVFLVKKVDTMEDWNEYCHYVAGLIGHGLSRLFVASGFEDAIVGKELNVANSMGLFLQKTNIIRDYLDDIDQKREFWPKAAWNRYAVSLYDFKSEENHLDGVHCLNELITNALTHIPHCLLYLSRLKNQSVFNFCAIPQVMAVATLERCYNNPDVLTGVVKIRKGEAVHLILSSTSQENVKAIFSFYVQRIMDRIPEDDPNAAKTRQLCDQALELCGPVKRGALSPLGLPISSAVILLSGVLWYYWG